MVKEITAPQSGYSILDSFKKNLYPDKPKEWLAFSHTEKVQEVLKEVSTIFSVPVEKIAGKSRKKEVVIVRQFYCYIAQKITGAALREIGEQIGGRDHTTVIHSKDTVIDMFYTNDQRYMNYWYQYKACARPHLIP